MKTNQIMIRDDNRFVQRTKDGYFNASALINSVDNTSKSTRHYKATKSYKEFERQLKSEGIDKPYLSSNKGVWMHPKMFVDFAMYVSVEFKSKVIDYVLDGLIKSRHDAGDYYKEMCVAIANGYADYFGKKPTYTIYAEEARRIKKLLCIDEERNDLSESDLQNITTLQKVNTSLINKKTSLHIRVKQLQMVAESLTGKQVDIVI